MQRPVLSRALSEAEFRKWYWLKSELESFCRSERLRVGGSKQELAARVSALLASRPLPTPARRRAPASPMPLEFEPDTLIQPGWRCSQGLRRFFESQVGSGFVFNAALGEFIASVRVDLYETHLHTTSRACRSRRSHLRAGRIQPARARVPHAPPPQHP